MGDDLTIRRADASDLPGVLALARRALGWTDDSTEFLEWKHLQNPFGDSPMWLALDGERIAGFRAFLRWEFTAGGDRVVRAVRAVDTATDPDYQGRGIFTLLTQTAIGELPDLGVEMIFNTPNEKSLPGYLKMGWSEVGRLPVAVMPTSWRFPFVVASARAAAERAPVPTASGEAPDDVFSSPELDDLFASQPHESTLSTRRSREFLRWRYGNKMLGYRVVMLDHDHVARGMAIFRRRRRGRAAEAVLCDAIAPVADHRQLRRLTRRVAATAGADYVIRIDAAPFTIDPFVRVPRIGPVLVCRLVDGGPVPSLGRWGLGMGDIELF
ncbi:MAG TPA: GNAT family N-acetyltransferase [Acidimicrobiia bacterium]|nr:GNAT family N-acetyltransferase [Acidimicrobiia bacterium]